MKLNKLISVLSAAAITAAPFFGSTAYAEGTEQEAAVTNVTSVFEEFNPLDVNGSVVVNLPEGSSAEIEITAVTPEGEYEYYYGEFNALETPVLSFDIEGNDDRTYLIGITATELERNISTELFLGEFSIPDADFNADSWKNYVFTIALEKNDTEDPYTFESNKTTENGITTIDTLITFYVPEDFVKGDVNDDGSINAIDASLVLTEYALTATTQTSSFTAKQKGAANVNEDASIDAIDASKILTYYAMASTGNTPSWD